MYVISIKPAPFISPIIDRIKLINLPQIKPKNIPITPPINPISIDSVRNNLFTSSVVMPIAFINPTSLVLSNKDTVRVLNMPREATPKATPPNKPKISLIVENS